MFREFFLHERVCQRLFAWIGAAWTVALAYAMTQTMLFYNAWLGGLFSFAQQESGAFLTSGNATLSSEALLAQEAATSHYIGIIVQYLKVMIALASFRAVSDFGISHFGIAWRMSLIDSYLKRWEAMPPSQATIEGASQRIQEDTQRFTVGIEKGAPKAFDAVFKMIVFGPLIVGFGPQVRPPRAFLELYAASGFYSDVHDGVDIPTAGTHYPSGWLLHFLIVAAILSFGVAMLATRHLIEIEVNNQKIEAALRKQLVYAEALTEDSASEKTDAEVQATPPTESIAEASLVRASRAPSAYGSKLRTLHRNYGKMYCNLLSFEFWTHLVNETIFVAPFFFCGHQLFDSINPIDIGDLIRIGNGCRVVYDAIAMATTSWASINEFRSVVRRLREFEERLPDISAVRPSKGDHGRSEADLM